MHQVSGGGERDLLALCGKKKNLTLGQMQDRKGGKTGIFRPENGYYKAHRENGLTYAQRKEGTVRSTGAKRTSNRQVGIRHTREGT